MDYIITGGHTGIGLALTRKLLVEGHRIGLVVRSESRKEEAGRQFNENDSVEIFVADLANRDDISKLGGELISNWDKVDGLFNNAGLLLDKLYLSDYGNELQLEVNGISPYLLAKALKPLLDKAEKPFVVNTATAGLHNKKSFDIPSFKKPEKFTKLMGSYLDSKLVLVMLMNHLDEQWPNIRFASVNPGPIKTKMTKGSGMPSWLKPFRNLLFKSPEKGAQTLYDAAFDPQFAQSGIYINEGKIRPMKVKISEKDIENLMA